VGRGLFTLCTLITEGDFKCVHIPSSRYIENRKIEGDHEVGLD